MSILLFHNIAGNTNFGFCRTREHGKVITSLVHMCQVLFELSTLHFPYLRIGVAKPHLWNLIAKPGRSASRSVLLADVHALLRHYHFITPYYLCASFISVMHYVSQTLPVMLGSYMCSFFFFTVILFLLIKKGIYFFFYFLI